VKTPDIVEATSAGMLIVAIRLVALGPSVLVAVKSTLLWRVLPMYDATRPPTAVEVLSATYVNLGAAPLLSVVPVISGA